MLNRIAIVRDMIPSGTVTCAFCASSEVTLDPVSSDEPRSPRKIPPIHSRYWSRERLVQSEPLADRLDLLGRAVRAGDQLGDVARQHAQGEEDQHAGHEKPEQKQGQSCQRVADHPLLLASSARLRRSFTLTEGKPVMFEPTATTEAPL